MEGDDHGLLLSMLGRDVHDRSTLMNIKTYGEVVHIILTFASESSYRASSSVTDRGGVKREGGVVIG